MHRAPKLILSAVIVGIVILALASYGYFQSREYLRGPIVTITEPVDGSASTTSLIAIIGVAKNVSFLTLNGRQIFTDERGVFKESLLLSDGYNILTLEGKDRFGHTATKRLKLVYKPQIRNRNTNQYEGTNGGASDSYIRAN